MSRFGLIQTNVLQQQKILDPSDADMLFTNTQEDSS